MEAILELLVALIVQPILLTSQFVPFVAFLIGLVIEFAFTAASKGITEAKSSVSANLKTQQVGLEEKRSDGSDCFCNPAHSATIQQPEQ